MLLRVLTLLLSLQGCAAPELEMTNNLPVYQSFLDKWNEMLATNFMVTVVVDPDNIVTTQAGRIIATCNSKGLVTVYTKVFDNLTDQEKEMTMFHEFGHCTLALPHELTKFNDGCPATIMYPSIPPDRCISKYKSVYLEKIKEKYKP